MERSKALASIANRLVALNRCSYLLVGVDGATASGKSTFAAGLANQIENLGRPSVVISIDGFHNPAEVRTSQGPLSPEGYVQDSFNYHAFQENVLDHFKDGGDGFYRPAVYDLGSESAIKLKPVKTPPRSVIIVDGVMLLNPAVASYWDFLIYLDVSGEEILKRGLGRDLQKFGSEDHLREKYLLRYLPGQQIYEQQSHIRAVADLVIINEDPQNPQIAEKSKPERQNT